MSASHQPKTTQPNHIAHARAQHPVTQGTHDAEILHGRANGMSTERMGAKFGCCTATVRNRIAAMRAAGLAVNKPCRKRPASIVMQADAICRMRGEGYTLAEIGRALGCSDRTVVKRIGALQQAGDVASVVPHGQ